MLMMQAGNDKDDETYTYVHREGAALAAAAVRATRHS